MWPSVIEDEEVRRAFEDKKCSNNSSTPFIWPLFKRAELRGGALWTNSSSLLKEDLGMNYLITTKSHELLIKKKMFLALGTGDSSLSGGKLKKCKMVSVFT